MPNKICLQCGKKHNRRKFCSNKCKDRWWNIKRGIPGFVKRKLNIIFDEFEEDYLHPLEDDNFTGEW